MVGLTLNAKRADGMALSVSLGNMPDGNWVVLAIETASANKSPKAVLDDHAHQMLGEFGLAQATRVAEEYALQWLAANGQARAPVCACEDIKFSTSRLSAKEIADLVACAAAATDN